MLQSVTSGHFKPYDLAPVKFKIDNIEYSFDSRLMLWKSQSVLQEVEKQLGETHKSKSKVTMDQKSIFEQNEKDILSLRDKIVIYEANIEKYRGELQEAKINQEQLINEYIIEHLETEKVKNARERLDQLKKELGI